MINTRLKKNMGKKKNKKSTPPQMSPYVFTVLLIGFGLWCFWDGWITSDPEMLEHSTFNRILSGALLPYGIYDYFKIRKRINKEKESKD